MSRLAQQHGAINLGQGFPSFQPHPDLIALVTEAMVAGHNQYAPMEGLMTLREAISNKNLLGYGYQPDPVSEITVCSGGTEALFAAIATCITAPGDEVILLQPCYDSYGPAILLNGGVPRYSDLLYPTYSPDWDHIRQLINPKTKAIVINTPHNPTGTIWSTDDIQQLGRLAEAHDLIIIADEVYEHITFDGRQHESILRYPDLYERAIVIHSFGKTYHATGFKLGYALAPAHLTAELRKIHQYLTFASFTPLQHALATFLGQTEHYLGLSAFYQTKRDQMLSAFAPTPLVPLDCEGTYFQLYDYTALSNLPDKDFAIELTTAAGVTGIPVSSFYHQGNDQRLLRFCFAKDEALMQAAADKIMAYANR